MRSPNYRAEEVRADGKLRPVKSGPIRTYRGIVRDMSGARARFTIDEKGIEGLIATRDALYFIESARKYSSSAGSADYVLYNSSDVVAPSDGGCGVTLSEVVGSRVENIKTEQSLPNSIQGQTNSAAGTSNMRVVEIATEADYEYVTALGGSAQANDEILSIMNQVDGIYNTDVGIGFTVVYQHTWATADDPYTSASGNTTLNEFTSYWNANLGNVARDLAHMFTFRDMDFAGIAWIGVACNNPALSYGISRRRTWRQATIVAHEFGHNFGATHIDNTSSCEESIMLSGAGSATTFCEFSRNQINNHVAKNTACLSDTPTSCDYKLSATVQSLGPDAGGGAVSITADGGCNWLATSNVNWISIVGAGNPDSPSYFFGNGSATLGYTVAANSGYTRKGTISIAGQSFTVTQAGQLPDCALTTLGLGQTANGTLSSSDCGSAWLYYFAPADTYSFNGAAGQQIRLSLNADSFVPYLYLAGPDGGLVGTSNFNGGPNNAYIPAANSLLTLPTTGMYTIEVTSLAGTVAGSYTLNTAATPAVSTEAASSVSITSAELHGTVNPIGSATNIWFEWGTSSTLSSFNSTPQQFVGSGSTNLSVSADIIGLAPGATHYYRLAASNSTGTARGPILSFTTLSNNIQVTVQTSPEGRSFTVDETTYTSAQTFTWASGSSHTISTTSTQSGTTGTRYVWSSWSDGGAITHTVSPTTNATYAADFTTQYLLTMNAGTGGSVSPSSNWYDSGQSVSVTATPGSGYTFSGWTGSGSGSYTGADNPASVALNGPVTQTASFSQLSQAPSVTTGAASTITLASATLGGSINPNGSLTNAWFEWGTSNSLSSFSSTSPQGVGSGSALTQISATLSNLAANTTYYYRVTASNSGGSTQGTIQSFTTAPGGILQFSGATVQQNEGDARATFNVTRTGDTSGTVMVDYRTTDTDTFTVSCADTTNNNGGAFARCDFAATSGTLSFAPGETAKTITVPIIDDGHDEGAETFQLRLSNVTGSGATLGTQNVATVTITDNDEAGAPNPIITLSPSDYPFFVRQQYLDFLSREPEQNQPWTAVLNRCPNIHTPPSAVTDCDRIAVSGAFFGSPEFRVKGFYVFRFYKVAFNRLPQYAEIVADMSFVAGATEAEVYARKAQLATAFVARTEFLDAYGNMSNADYVNALLGRYHLTSVTTPDPAAPDGAAKVTLTSAALTNGLNAGTLTRAQALRAVADSDQVGTEEYNSAFVAVQYYGYLRRTPDDNGYQAWLRVINQDPNNVRIMVNGFMNSTEYRLRFGQP